ncbi:hypothetical protein ALC62_07173 [Cyphomyrmex costatus]|uniref:Uncharacterized protein n=1 Tax=Cyphomyrmex costatus TaxID=456900 RepID=A0A151IHY2_9HYME|nr:hypothetical protein ALC62_07173 [Cyphomyrmex costatus]
MIELLAALRKIEAKHGQDFERDIRENHKNIERERFKGTHKEQLNYEKKTNDTNSTRHKPDVTRGATNSEYIKESIKSKRSVNDSLIDDFKREEANGKRHNTRRIVVPKARSYANNENNTNDNFGTDPTSHPPKKYHSNALETIPPARHDRLSEGTTQPDRYESENMETVNDRRISWRNRDISRNQTEIRQIFQNHEAAARENHRRLTRRHLRAPRQVYAIHYGADSSLFSTQDEHTGNGRARHYNGVFRAWQPSEWVADLGMSRHFTLAGDGKLTVHEPGLYLVYAQIHYLDEHDENGFHVLVNGRPILQCMVRIEKHKRKEF